MNLIRERMKSRIEIIGRWTATGHSPLVVSDPIKARVLLGLPTKHLNSRENKCVEECILPLSLIRRCLPVLTTRERKEVEQLLSGSRRLFHDEFTNIVVNQGLNDLLDVTLSGATQDTTWFVGLTDGTPTVAAGDTLASHAGWVEVTAYDETNRVAWVDAGASGQSISNSASPAVFTISANGTVVGGGFLAGVNTGTSGRLYAVGGFSGGDKTLDDNETLDVTATFTTTAA